MKTLNSCTYIFNHIATCPDPSITCREYDTYLRASLDPSNISATNGHSREGCHHFLRSKPNPTTNLKEQNIVFNTTTHAEASILKLFMNVALEVDISGSFVGNRQDTPERMCLLETKNPQEKKPVELDNTTNYRRLIKTLLQKCSKAIDMSLLAQRQAQS